MKYIKSVERIFWPVGQGAFYSEKLKFDDGKEFNIVYDCGSRGSKGKDLIKIIIEKYFKGTTIDILFISHFDSDHVYGIPELKNKAKIKNVVIPLIHENDKILLDFYYDKINNNEELRKLVSSSDKFFGEETNVILVNYDEHPSDSRLEETFNIDNASNQENINSGTRITTSNYEWIFIPHNIHFEKKSKQLNQALMNIVGEIEGIEKIEDLKNIKNYDEQIIKKIRDIFNSKEIEGTINSNSMYLYSGSNNKSSYINQSFQPKQMFLYNSRCTNKISALYTGDGNLKKDYDDIKNKYKKYWDGIGTIQVPHHGSKNSFNEKLYEEKNKIFVISAGENEYYNHPNEKIKKELSKKNLLFHVSYNFYYQKSYYFKKYLDKYMINFDIWEEKEVTIHKMNSTCINNKEIKRKKKYIFSNLEEFNTTKHLIPSIILKYGFWILNLEKSQVMLNDKPNRLYLEKLFDSYLEKFNISFCGNCLKHLRKGVK